MAAFSSGSFSTTAFSEASFDFGSVPPVVAYTAYIGSSKKKPRRVRASDMVASSFPEIDTRAQRMKRNAAIFTILH